jgi:hypothetical protein
MGKTIEVRLSDAQYAALSAEAEASGQTFFGYCRSKLTANADAHTYGVGPMMRDLPAIRAENNRKLTEAFMREAERVPPYIIPEPDDRIGRLETMMMEMGRAIQNLANPAYVAEPQLQEPQEPVDVDSIVNAQFAEAEAQGLTEHVPDENEEVMQHAGVRPVMRRPTPFSASNAPRHLQQLL